MRSLEAVIVVVDVSDFELNGTFWIDLEELKIAYIKTADAGVVRFIEENAAEIGKL